MATTFGIRDIITADYLKKTLLVGVDLTDDNGNDYPDELFDAAIDMSISVIETELGIVIDEYSNKGERHDGYSGNKFSWWGSQLDLRPLKAVDKVEITYGNYPAVSIPIEWVNISSAEAGSIHLIPTAETLGTFRFSNALPLLTDPITAFRAYERVPVYFNYDYTAGFNFIEQTITVPVNTNEVLDIAINENLVDKPNFIFEVLDDGNGNVGGQSYVVKAFNVSEDKYSIRLPAASTPLLGDATIKVRIHTVPQIMIKAIMYMAAFLPLDTAGDLIAGAGIGAFALEVDGLKQNIQTTSSATSAGYGAKIISYRTQLKAAIASLKAKYRLKGLAIGF
tara:strand:- start:14321 stop:15331 length:1011 start_codon:yes stop_codon:yes gene_type:complete